MTKDLDKKQSTLPMVADFQADAGMGMEGADKDSFAIPFISVLQGLSPQCETVNGAKPGLIINNITNELFQALEFVPVAFSRKFNRWVPRDEGGGFRGSLTVAEVEAGRANGSIKESQEKQGVLETVLDGETVEVRDTRDHYVLFKSASDTWHPAVISLGSTGIKQSKRLMTLIQSIQLRGKDGALFTPPSFSHIFSMKTEKESNDKGTWYTPVFATVGPVDAEVYAMAKSFYEKVRSGDVKVAPPTDDLGTPVAGDGKKF